MLQCHPISSTPQGSYRIFRPPPNCQNPQFQGVTKSRFLTVLLSLRAPGIEPGAFSFPVRRLNHEGLSAQKAALFFRSSYASKIEGGPATRVLSAQNCSCFVISSKNNLFSSLALLQGLFCLPKQSILVFSAARGFFLSIANSNLCPEHPHRPPEAPGSD